MKTFKVMEATIYKYVNDPENESFLAYPLEQPEEPLETHQELDSWLKESTGLDFECPPPSDGLSRITDSMTKTENGQEVTYFLDIFYFYSLDLY